ncbi:lysine--tRNA ligase MSK1 [Lachancea thermotolerans CBS 6340]|uniref:lysine--tRNA ligase n=1 Tax=Lachancea thermotolerans (strain ATCC 56472 / CBS 6340 / NRRL Y-8284) TaxID=559295 RepID=C5DMH3_LACTC|nr:KLTH0G08954p [Lachancea thermotolerans CBS 6340]CAR24984.1 KLTH0G08954p [Lachancea thermotolerans CBS 6340]
MLRPASPLARSLARGLSTALDFARRNEAIAARARDFYPSLSRVAPATATVAGFVRKYCDLEHDRPDLREVLRARVDSVRVAGKNMCFVDVSSARCSTQLILNYNVMAAHAAPGAAALSRQQFFQHVQDLRPGDHVQACGFPGRSQRERTLSLKCTQLTTLLAPALRALPPRLSDPAKRNQNRVLDYLVNGHDALRVRHSVLSALREFLDARGFLEAETPVLSPKANGAAAEPFTTRTNATNAALQLRVAPELWLKRLVVAGVDRVYELGRVFRNEGVDASHNPEFTTLEFYQTYASMEDLIALAEQLLLHVLERADTARARELKAVLLANGGRFARVEFLPTLQRETGIDFSQLDLADPRALAAALEARGIELDTADRSPQQILNALCARYIEDRHCRGSLPTLIFHHPTVMSPLAKGNPDDDMLTTKRFEVFIGGKEYINAYEEENCPQAQLQKFEAQQQAQEAYGDRESLAIDHAYVDAMKWGMPPIGGFGVGIDRLCMLLTGDTRIERVLSFGTIDDIGKQ